MTTARIALEAVPASSTKAGSKLMSYLTTTDHKVIARMYIWTAMAFFAFGGVLALAIRAELTLPGLQLLC